MEGFLGLAGVVVFFFPCFWEKGNGGLNVAIRRVSGIGVGREGVAEYSIGKFCDLLMVGTEFGFGRLLWY